MRFKHLCLAVGGVSVLLTGQASAQSAASCRKAEFKGGSPVFFYDKACMAKLKTVKKATVKKAVTAKTFRKPSPKIRSVQKLLAAKGYKPGVADGVMGGNTRKAIGQYYKKHGLKGSKMNAVLAHLKSRPNGGAAAKRARVAAIKKAVAAKRAAAKHATTTKSHSAGDGKKLTLYQRQQAQAAATSKTSGTAKKLTLYQRQQAQAAKATSKGVSSAQKAAKARAAKVAAIKKAVAAKRAAAAKTKTAAAKPSFMQRMKNKVKAAVYGKKAKTAGASDAQKAAKARAAKVAAIKKAVAAKRAAAAAKKKVATKTPAAAKGDKNIADLQSLLSAKGKYAGKVDGTMNIETRKSVISYYYANKLDVGKGTIAQAVHKDLKSGGAKKTVAAAKVTAQPASVKKASSGPSLYERQQALAAKSKVAGSAPKVAAKKKVSSKAASAAKGDKNVADLQSLLAAKGKYAGKVDGTMNIETRKSVISYYYANKLDVGKGTIAQAVHKDLKSGGAKKTVAAAKAKPKSSGNKVVDIQTMLAKKGLYSGKSNGLLDSPTRKSILGYYKKHKLKRNGGTIIDTVHSHLSGGTV